MESSGMTDKTTGLDPNVVYGRTIERLTVELDKAGEWETYARRLSCQTLSESGALWSAEAWYKKMIAAWHGDTAQPVPQAAGWKEVRHAPADKDILLYCPHLNATNPERMEVGYYRTTAGGTMHSWATHWMELPPTPCAPIPSEPVLSEQAALEAIREQFENWLTGEGDWPHLKYKNFGGSYITDEACMKWDAYKAGVKAALQNAAK